MTVQRKGDSYHHGDLRRALIDAALELIDQRGVDGLTLREAARRVGVTHSAPYRHFADKAELVAAVRIEGFELLYHHLSEACASAPDPVAAVKSTGIAYIEFAVQRPAHFRVMFGTQLAGQASSDPSLARASKRAYRVLAESIDACQRAGLVREGDVGQHAMAAWSIVHGLAALLVNGLLPRDGATVAERARFVTDQLYAGLASHREGA